MRTEILGAEYEIHFDSPLDLPEQKPVAVNAARWEYTRNHGGRDWSLVRDFADFETRVRTGWHELIEETRRASDSLVIDPALTRSLITVSRRRAVSREQGDELDFDAWRRRDLDKAWRTTERFQIEQHRTRAACIYVDVCAPANRRPSEMLWRAAAACRLAQALTSGGWSIEIVVGASCDQMFDARHRRSHITFTAKPATMPMSIERLALMTSAAWFRYYVFLAMDSNQQKFVTATGRGIPVYVVPPYVKRMEARGYHVLAIPGSAISQHGAQIALNDLIQPLIPRVA
jgi:hypothetical protein